MDPISEIARLAENELAEAHIGPATYAECRSLNDSVKRIIESSAHYVEAMPYSVDTAQPEFLSDDSMMAIVNMIKEAKAKLQSRDPTLPIVGLLHSAPPVKFEESHWISFVARIKPADDEEERKESDKSEPTTITEVFLLDPVGRYRLRDFNAKEKELLGGFVSIVDCSAYTKHMSDTAPIQDSAWWAALYIIKMIHTKCDINRLDAIKRLGSRALRSCLRFDVNQMLDSDPHSSDTKTSGLRKTLHGVVYQLQLLLLYLHRAIAAGIEFRLATELPRADKFDDLVFKWIDNKQTRIRYLQAKHKFDDGATISWSDLTDLKKGEFSLPKYFRSFRNIKRNFARSNENAVFHDFIICTNIGMAPELVSTFEEIPPDDPSRNGFFDFTKQPNLPEQPKLWKFKENFDVRNHLTAALLPESDVELLAKLLVPGTPTISFTHGSYFVNPIRLTRTDAVTKRYLGLLFTESVLERLIGAKEANAKFANNFLSGLTGGPKALRKAIIERMKKINNCEEGDALKSLGEQRFHVPDDLCWYQPNPPAVCTYRTKTNSFDKDVKIILTSLLDCSKQLQQGCTDVVDIKRLSTVETSDFRSYLPGHVFVGRPYDEEFGSIKQQPIYFAKSFIDGTNVTGFIKKLRDALIDGLNEAKAGDLAQFANSPFRIPDFHPDEEGDHKLPDDRPTLIEVNEFLAVLVFALHQPNVDEMAEILYKDAEINLSKSSAILLTEYTKGRMLDWMKKKEGSWLTTDDGKKMLNEASDHLNCVTQSGSSRALLAGFQRDGMHIQARDGVVDEVKLTLPVIPQDIRKRALLIDSRALNKDERAILMWRLAHTIKSAQAGEYVVVDHHTLEEQLQGLTQAAITKRWIISLVDVPVTEGQPNPVATDALQSLMKISGMTVTIVGSEIAGYNVVPANECCELFNNDVLTQVEFLWDWLHDDLRSRIRMVRVQLGSDSITLAWFIRALTFRKLKPTLLWRLCIEHFQFTPPIQIAPPLKKLSELDKACYQTRWLIRSVRLKPKCLRDCSDVIVLYSRSPLVSVASFIDSIDPSVSVVSWPLEVIPAKGEPWPRLLSITDEKEFDNILKHSSYKDSTLHLVECVSDDVDDSHLERRWSHRSLTNMRPFFEQEELTDESRFARRMADACSDGENDHTRLCRVSVISADPGFGKSLLLVSLASKIRELAPHVCIYHLILQDIADSLVAVMTVDSLEDALSALTLLDNTSSAPAGGLLLTCCRHQCNVLILLDGYDELHAGVQFKARMVVRWLQLNSRVRFVITTRVHMQRELEDEFKTIAWTLKEFNNEVRLEYLEAFYTFHSANSLSDRVNPVDPAQLSRLVSTFAVTLNDRLTSLRDASICSFMGVPLQMWMVSEAFLSDWRRLRDSTSREMIRNANQEQINQLCLSQLPANAISLTSLYGRFVTTKSGIARKRLKLPDGLLIQALANAIDIAHEAEAVKLLFPARIDGDCLTYSSLNRNPEMGSLSLQPPESFSLDLLLRIGILRSIHPSSNQLGWVHRTFAEFFCAQRITRCILEERDGVSSDTGVMYTTPLGVILLRHLFKGRMKVVRTFLVEMICANTTLQTRTAELVRKLDSRILMKKVGNLLWQKGLTISTGSADIHAEDKQLQQLQSQVEVAPVQQSPTSVDYTALLSNQIHRFEDDTWNTVSAHLLSMSDVGVLESAIRAVADCVGKIKFKNGQTAILDAMPSILSHFYQLWFEQPAEAKVKEMPDLTQLFSDFEIEDAWPPSDAAQFATKRARAALTEFNQYCDSLKPLKRFAESPTIDKCFEDPPLTSEKLYYLGVCTPFELNTGQWTQVWDCYRNACGDKAALRNHTIASHALKVLYRAAGKLESAKQIIGFISSDENVEEVLKEEIDLCCHLFAGHPSLEVPEELHAALYPNVSVRDKLKRIKFVEGIPLRFAADVDYLPMALCDMFINEMQLHSHPTCRGSMISSYVSHIVDAILKLLGHRRKGRHPRLDDLPLLKLIDTTICADTDNIKIEVEHLRTICEIIQAVLTKTKNTIDRDRESLSIAMSSSVRILHRLVTTDELLLIQLDSTRLLLQSPSNEFEFTFDLSECPSTATLLLDCIDARRECFKRLVAKDAKFYAGVNEYDDKGEDDDEDNGTTTPKVKIPWYAKSAMEQEFSRQCGILIDDALMAAISIHAARGAPSKQSRRRRAKSIG